MTETLQEQPQESPAVVPLAFKPDLADAARRWQAYYAGDLIDRPLVVVTAMRPASPRRAASPTRSACGAM
jgi:hypothetical protein